MNTGIIKGFRDFTDEEAEKREAIKKIIVETFSRYGFEPAETPIIEREEFAKGENTNDEAVSDIFRLKDRGRRKLALRYEFTFQLKRIAGNKKLPYKRYQIGEVFRDEPISENRLRQFTQCDADIVGVSNIPARDEAEIIALFCDILKQLGIAPTVLINNRRLLNGILEDLKIKKNKEQILKELDKIDKLPEKQIKNNLKKLEAEKILSVLKQGEEYFSKFNAYKEIISLMEYCRAYGISVKFSPTIVRGLSYYNGTVFEIKAQGIKETIAGGGSYMIDKNQATGCSFGLERLALLSKIKEKKDKVLIISLEQDREAIKLLQKLRSQGNNVMIYYGKPSKALDYANSKKINKVIFVGKDEIQKGKFKIRNMETGKEELINF